MTVRYQGADAPAHVHLRDAMHHLANARRSLEHALWQTNGDDDRRRLQALDVAIRKIGAVVARTGR